MAPIGIPARIRITGPGVVMACKGKECRRSRAIP